MKKAKQPKNSSSHKLSLLVFLFSFSFFVLCSSGTLESEDGWLYSSVARNVYYNHQIASAPYEYPHDNVHMNTVLGKDGVWRAPGSLGYSLSLVPAIALSDLVHRLYGANPPQHFPLQHDWSFHFFGSFTNAFWAALLVLFMFWYAQELRFTRQFSFLLAFTTIATTNLLTLSKSSFAHMMFATCMVASFYFIKRYAKEHRLLHLFLAGISYLLLAISYNVTYYLPFLPLFTYLVILETRQRRKKWIFLFILATFIFAILSPARFTNILSSLRMSPKVLFEGVWGFLFSSGKSIFLYSPPLALIPLFWHKIKKDFLPEAVACGLLAFFYLLFVGSASIMDHSQAVGIWHGGMAWGPRYFSAVIPLGMLVVFHIVSNLYIWQKKLIVIPIFLAGFSVQLIGAGVIYLLQYRDIPYNIFIGESEVTVYDYASFMPRYSPFIAQSRSFVYNLLTLPQTINRGPYEVRFIDGFDMPHRTANGIIRGFREEGYITLKNPTSKPLQVSMRLSNVPDDSSSQAVAKIEIATGEKKLQVDLDPASDQEVNLRLEIPRGKATTLSFVTHFTTTPTIPHVIYIKKFTVNGMPTSMASLDYPEVSTIGEKSSPIPYRYFGKSIKDNWKAWHMRARINERTLDFWWIKNLYYWDRPQKFIWGLFAITIITCALSGRQIYKKLKT